MPKHYEIQEIEMFIEVHNSAHKNEKVLLNTDYIISVFEDDGECNIEVGYESYRTVTESYDAIKAKLMPRFKANDDVAERLRRREEFFRGKEWTTT